MIAKDRLGNQGRMKLSLIDHPLLHTASHKP